MSIIKELFSDDLKKVKTPETLGMIMILLLIFKKILPDQYLLISSSIVQELGILKTVVQFVQLVAGMYFILSIIVSFSLIIFTTRYVIVDLLKDYFKKEYIWKIDLSKELDKAQRFFIGSKIATLKVNSWFLVIVGYFYLLDSSNFMEYYKIISSHLDSSNLISSFAIIYFFVIIFCVFYLIKNIVYKLYFTY